MTYAADEKALFEELIAIMRRCVSVILSSLDSLIHRQISAQRGLWLCSSVGGGLFRFDPDILVGYEIQMRSWGYLLQRAAVLGADLCQQLSRVPGTARLLIRR